MQFTDREEIIEALGVTVMMGGGPSLMYAAHVMEAIEEFAQKIGDKYRTD